MIAIVPVGRLAAADEPTAAVDDTQTTIGQVISINGTNWEPEAIVKVEICGNNALDGSVDCNQTASSTVRIWTTSELVARLTVVEPPSPCPCVVQITTASGVVAAQLPIEIEGVAVESPVSKASDGSPALTIVKVSIDDTVSLTSFMGGAARRTLELVVHNDNVESVTDPTLTLGWGQDGRIDQVIDAPDLDPFAPGDVQVITVDFELSPLSIGTYQVRGEIGSRGALTSFEDSTSTWPVGLFIAIDLAVFALLLYLGRAAVRRWGTTTARPGDAGDMPTPLPVDALLRPDPASSLAAPLSTSSFAPPTLAPPAPVRSLHH